MEMIRMLAGTLHVPVGILRVAGLVKGQRPSDRAVWLAGMEYEDENV